MRALIRAYSAGHPVVTAVMLAVRWVLWLASGHPLAVLVVLAALLVGAPPIAGLVLAALIESAVLNVGRFRPSGPARFVWVWSQAMAFRRRWPSAYAEAYVQPEFDRAAVFPGNYYSAPDGLRPVLVSPRLRLLPTSVRPSSVIWRARPWSAQDFRDTDAQVRRLARADDRVLRAELARQDRGQRLQQHRRRWDLEVVFAEPSQDPDSGSSATNVGHEPGASGDGSGADSLLHRGRRSNGAGRSRQSFRQRQIDQETKNRSRRVVHDVGNRESNKG